MSMSNDLFSGDCAESGTVELEAVYVHLALTDPDVLVALNDYEPGPARNKFVELALKIGVLSLRAAKGTVDGEAIKSNGERLISQLGERLQSHRDLIDQALEGTLRGYFDPNSGHFAARVAALTQDDGELAQLVRRQVGGESEKLRALLEGYLGTDGELSKLLVPGSENVFLMDLQSRLQSTLAEERNAMMSQFSLDQPDSALTRLVREIKATHGDVATALATRLNAVVDEFSLDKQDSALSRLVGRVEQAQKSITDEFTLDRPESALRRLLDHLVSSIAVGQKSQVEFQTSVIQILSSLQAQKKAEARSTTHGHAFEENVGNLLADVCTRQADVFEPTGSSTGTIRNCKVGDFVITLGPDCAAAGAKIVVEAKEDASYTVKSTLDEADEARRNRGAGVCLFVHSKRTGPAAMEPVSRFGNDIVVVWDPEDSNTDLNVRAGLMVAKAMSVRKATQANKEASSWVEIDRAIEAIRKQTANFAELKTSAETIQRATEKSLDRIRIMAKGLDDALASMEANLSGMRVTE